MPIQKAVFFTGWFNKRYYISYKVCLMYLLAVPSVAVQLKLCLSYRDRGLRNHAPLQVLLFHLSI